MKKNSRNKRSDKVAKIIGSFNYEVTRDCSEYKTTYNVTKNVTYDVLNEKVDDLIESNNVKIAKKMIAKRIPTKDVIEITGLSREKVLNLLKTA